jgi:hypothetical protein
MWNGVYERPSFHETARFNLAWLMASAPIPAVCADIPKIRVRNLDRGRIARESVCVLVRPADWEMLDT